jgi:hypothetical protein
MRILNFSIWTSTQAICVVRRVAVIAEVELRNRLEESALS